MLLRKKENKSKSKKSQFLLIGSLLLIIFGTGIIGFKYYEGYHNN